MGLDIPFWNKRWNHLKPHVPGSSSGKKFIVTIFGTRKISANCFDGIAVFLHRLLAQVGTVMDSRGSTVRGSLCKEIDLTNERPIVPFLSVFVTTRMGMQIYFLKKLKSTIVFNLS